MTTAAHVSYRLEEVVERSYSAFCSAQSGVSSNGQRHVPWQALPATEKSGWMAAVDTAIAIANGRAVTDPHALREAELAGKVPDDKRPGGQQIPDEEEENAKTSSKSKDDSHATSRKAHSAGR